MKKNYLLVIAFITTLMAHAQCGPSFANNSTTTGFTSIGISFTTDASCGGTLTSVTIEDFMFQPTGSGGPGDFIVRLYDGNGVSGSLLSELINVPGVSGDLNVDFSPEALTMSASTQYTIIVYPDPSDTFLIPTGFNTYTGGSLFVNEVEQVNEHLAFSVEIDDSMPPSPSATFPSTWEFRGVHEDFSIGAFTGPGPSPAGLDTALLPTANERLSSPVLVDLDDDGDLDFVSGSQDTSGKLFYFENTGTSTSPNWVQTALPTLDAIGFSPGTNNETKCQFIDIDDDGDYDLFYGSRFDAAGNKFDDIHYYENTGTAAVPNFVASTITGILNQNLGEFPSFGFVDLDNDNDYDMVTMGSDSLAYFRNTGTKMAPVFERKFHLENPWDMNTGAGINDRNWPHNDVLATVPNFFDIDADGDYDMCFGKDNGTFSWIENIGTASAPDFGTYAYQSFGADLGTFDMGQFSVMSLGDVTGDGIVDTIFGSFNPGYFAWLEGLASCETPTNLDAFANSETTAPAAWFQSVDGETNWQFTYGLSGFNINTEGTTIDVSGSPSVNLTGLAPGTTYDCYVRALCSTGQYGAYTLPTTFTTQGTLSTSVFDEPNKITLYPNPASDFITIRLSNPSSALTEIKLYNITGQEIYSKYHEVNNNKINLNVSNLKTGLYFLKIKSNGQTSIVKKLNIK